MCPSGGGSPRQPRLRRSLPARREMDLQGTRVIRSEKGAVDDVVGLAVVTGILKKTMTTRRQTRVVTGATAGQPLRGHLQPVMMALSRPLSHPVSLTGRRTSTGRKLTSGKL